MSAREIFTFFYTLNSIPSFFPFPVHQIPIFVRPPSTMDEATASLSTWVEFLVGRELFHDIVTGTNAKAGVEIYAPHFFARQLGFGQTWPVPPCYSKNITERFYLISKAETGAIDARNKILAEGFSFVPFNPTAVTHPLFDQLWPSVKRRLFSVNANRAFHSLDRSETLPSSPILATPLSIKGPSKSPSASHKRSNLPSASSTSPAVATKGTSSRKRPAAASPVLHDDTGDDGGDDVDVPLIHKRKVMALFKHDLLIFMD
jgi:hypothetical protein